MMIRVPGLTDKGMRTTAFTEHIDLFPTLAEMAAGVKLPPCPTGRSQVRVHRCLVTRSTGIVRRELRAAESH